MGKLHLMPLNDPAGTGEIRKRGKISASIESPSKLIQAQMSAKYA